MQFPQRTPSSPAYRIEEEDGNCIIVTPLVSRASPPARRAIGGAPSRGVFSVPPSATDPAGGVRSPHVTVSATTGLEKGEWGHQQDPASIPLRKRPTVGLDDGARYRSPLRCDDEAAHVPPRTFTTSASAQTSGPTQRAVESPVMWLVEGDIQEEREDGGAEDAATCGRSHSAQGTPYSSAPSLPSRAPLARGWPATAGAFRATPTRRVPPTPTSSSVASSPLQRSLSDRGDGRFGQSLQHLAGDTMDAPGGEGGRVYFAEYGADGELHSHAAEDDTAAAREAEHTERQAWPSHFSRPPRPPPPPSTQSATRGRTAITVTDERSAQRLSPRTQSPVTSSPPVRSNGLPASAADAATGQARASLPPPLLPYDVLAGPGRLGPLIVVHTVVPAGQRSLSRRDAEDDSGTVAVVPQPGELPITAVTSSSAVAGHADEDEKDGGVLSPLEVASHRNELRTLEAKLAATEAQVAIVRREGEALAEQRAKEAAETHREEERRRRQQFQDALDRLREENADLTTQLELAQRGAGLGNGARGGQPPAVVEAEWTRRLHEVEGYWRERLRTAERHWEDEVEAQSREKRATASQVRDLTRALEQVQETLRHTASENQRYAAENERLREQLDTGADGESLRALREESSRLRGALHEHECREEALLAQLDSYGAESARMQLEHEEQLQYTRQQLAQERARNSELVRLYGSQVQSLHAQLQDAHRQRKEMAAKLAER